MKQYTQLAMGIRRGLLLIVGEIRRYQAVDPQGIGGALAEVLEAAADGIKAKFDIGGSEGRR